MVKSWDGTVAGVKDGERRRFDDLLGTDATEDVGNSSRASNNVVLNDRSSAYANAATEYLTHQRQPTEPSGSNLEPFAIIDQVFSNSPASTAGIQEGDILIQFGPIHSKNHDNFSAIAKLVPQIAGENKSVSIKVRRKKEMQMGEDSDVIDLELWPQVWEGRGLLGCHISKM